VSNVKISELPAASGANAGDEIASNQSGTTRKLTISQVRAGLVSSITAGTGLTGGTITSSGTVAADVASDANIRAGTASKLVAAAEIYSAAAPVSLSDGATITPDFNSGRVFTVTLAGNRVLANPTNQVAGQAGMIVVSQDGTGSRTLSYGNAWKFPGGAPTLTTTASAVDIISYYVQASGTIRATISKAFA
jgi:hypothetical protein